MSTATVGMAVRARDEASGVLKEIRDNLKTLRTGFAELNGAVQLGMVAWRGLSNVIGGTARAFVDASNAAAGNTIEFDTMATAAKNAETAFGGIINQSGALTSFYEGTSQLFNALAEGLSGVSVEGQGFRNVIQNAVLPAMRTMVVQGLQLLDAFTSGLARAAEVFTSAGVLKAAAVASTLPGPLGGAGKAGLLFAGMAGDLKSLSTGLDDTIAKVRDLKFEFSNAQTGQAGAGPVRPAGVKNATTIVDSGALERARQAAQQHALLMENITDLFENAWAVQEEAEAATRERIQRTATAAQVLAGVQQAMREMEAEGQRSLATKELAIIEERRAALGEFVGWWVDQSTLFNDSTFEMAQGFTAAMDEVGASAHHALVEEGTSAFVQFTTASRNQTKADRQNAAEYANAIAKKVQATLAARAIEAGIEATIETAKGLAALALGNVPSAGLHFAAAGKFAAIAGSAGTAAYALGQTRGATADESRALRGERDAARRAREGRGDVDRNGGDFGRGGRDAAGGDRPLVVQLNVNTAGSDDVLTQATAFQVKRAVDLGILDARIVRTQ